MDILNNLCRACNTEQKNVVHIFKQEVNESTSVIKMLEYCILETPDEELKYPSWICYTCVKQLEICYRFLKRFKLAQNEFEVAYGHMQAMEDTSSDVNSAIGHNDVEEEIIQQLSDQENDDVLQVGIDNVKSEEPVIEMSVSIEPSPDTDLHPFESTDADMDMSNLRTKLEKYTPSVVCSICHKTFFTTKALNLHLKLNHKQKSTVC